jgi:hypothetical protein
MSNFDGRKFSHEAFEVEVHDRFRSAGFFPSRLPYHTKIECLHCGMVNDVVSREIQNKMKKMITPTAYYLRQRSDQFAIYPNNKECLQFEVKTSPTKAYGFTMEAIQLVWHMNNPLVDTLYICKNITQEACFWVDEMPTPSKIIIPKKWDDPDEDYAMRCDDFEAVFRHTFTDVPIEKVDGTNGSGTPFVCMDDDAIALMVSDWHGEINRIATECEQGTKRMDVKMKSIGTWWLSNGR